jgi:hypothetical protein
MGGNALTGWAPVGLHVPEAVSVALAVVAFVLSITGLGLMIAARPGRLPLAAALDGMTAALVIQAVAGLILLAPVRHELRDGLGLVVVLYPLGDVLLMGLVAAVVAHGGVRRDPWTLALAGLVAMTVGDSASLPTSIAGAHHHAGVADLGWLAGTWLLAAAAWSPDAPARTERWIRGWVPVVLGAFALALFDLNGFKDYNDPFAATPQATPCWPSSRPAWRPAFTARAPRTAWAATSSACSSPTGRTATTRWRSARPAR